MRRWLVLVVLFTLALATPVPATGQGIQGIDAPLEDPGQESRAIALHKRLRCLVCQNQSIHDSNAELAQDLRVLVRERIADGDTDDQAVRYVVDRYGDWVLLRPPIKPATLALWLGPVAILFGAGLGAVRYLRRGRDQAPQPPLSDEERRRLDALMRET